MKGFGTFPVRGGVTGRLAFSVVAGYWQLDPSVAGGVKGGRLSGAVGFAGALLLMRRFSRRASDRKANAAMIAIWVGMTVLFAVFDVGIGGEMRSPDDVEVERLMRDVLVGIGPADLAVSGR